MHDFPLIMGNHKDLSEIRGWSELCGQNFQAKYLVVGKPGHWTKFTTVT